MLGEWPLFKDSMTNIDHKLLSPHSWPVQIGELAILIAHPRGFCVEIVQIDQIGKSASVRLLDAVRDNLSIRKYSLTDLIPTRKKPRDLVSMYSPSALELDLAVDRERSMPDFSKLKKHKSKSASKKKKEPKKLTPEQKKLMKKLLVERIRELLAEGD